MQADRTSELERIRQGVKACVVLFPLLGMTWVFGVLGVTDAGLVFQYIFTIVNSLQVFIAGFVTKENCGGDNFTSLMIYFPTVHKHLSSCLSLSIQMIIFRSLRKQPAFRDISPCFPAKGALRSHTDEVSLPRSGSCLSLVETNFPFNTTIQKHYQDLGSDKLSAWEFGSPQTLFRGETSGGVPKRWPRLRFQSC